MKPQILTPLQFDLAVAHGEVEGIAMGVLGDGTPYLTAAGLAHACGQTPNAIQRVTEEWTVGRDKPGWGRIAALAAGYGHREDILYRDVAIHGEPARVYPDPICMAILEYFAFEARSHTAYIAQQSFRMLARQSLRHFIYTRVGYDTRSILSDSWQYLHDRMALNPLPAAYFSVFREITGLFIAAIQAGLALGRHTVPDISVGMAWGRHWTSSGHDDRYGERRKHIHRYPTGLTKKDEVQAWIYPIAALGEFRDWMRDDYLPGRLAPYLARKANNGGLPPSRVEYLLAAVNDNL